MLDIGGTWVLYDKSHAMGVKIQVKISHSLLLDN